MADPNAKKISLFGKDFDLNLNAGALRLAQIKGEGIEPAALTDREDFDLGMHLAYIALLPDLEDGRTQEEVVKELVKSDMSNEAAEHCLGQYLEMQNELGKSLKAKAEQMESVTA